MVVSFQKNFLRPGFYICGNRINPLLTMHECSTLSREGVFALRRNSNLKKDHPGSRVAAFMALPNYPFMATTLISMQV